MGRRTSWNGYINSIYYPENTSADAPEKIIYYFLRDTLCSNETKGNAKFHAVNNKEWEPIFDCVDFKSSNELKKNFMYYYITELEGKKKSEASKVPVPFHTLIPCTFQLYTSNLKEDGEYSKLDNKGFREEFLLAFFLKEDGSLNYELIKKFWDQFCDENDLNYYEKFIIDQVRKNQAFTNFPELRSQDELEKKVDKYFICKKQPKQFQKELDFILKLEIPRVEKINWIQNLLYFHFSSYMLRIYTVIEQEERYFNSTDSDICIKCNGLKSCPLYSKILVKSSHTGYNSKEAREISEQFNYIRGNIFFNGYSRFIAFSVLCEIYEDLNGKTEPNNLTEIKKLIKNRNDDFIKKFKEKLKLIYEEINRVFPNTKDYTEIDQKNWNNENVFTFLYTVFKEYYEKVESNKKSSSRENATNGVFIKLAGNKMGCGYLNIVSSGNSHKFEFSSKFLTFITNIIIGREQSNKILLEDFWEFIKQNGFIYASEREKLNIEQQLVHLGMLEKKSDAGESIYIRKTIGI
ncbi:hypothetical protein HNQ80_001166 [Anaerosolibacter carboniphilus]|uniref:DNA phosphorothioation-dependent restriction protein DptG n=1 Tax=Anaerosolibacter carboniphilus TaxID=1417629 RepID=A0A841KNS4_9FIRM|nr:hypothetical protein [Anaerosolibacter carboniphilus]MBB6215077.1 hypothetical protein [Anaerosolibacter carboniphilus]